MEIKIREINANDASAVSELSVQLGYTLSVVETREQIEKVIATYGHCAFVAVAQEKIVGWIHAFTAITIESKPFVEISGLVVNEYCRSMGIGKKLVTRIREWAIEKGISSLRVRTNTKRLETHLFYSRIGFKELKEQKVFFLPLD